MASLVDLLMLLLCVQRGLALCVLCPRLHSLCMEERRVLRGRLSTCTQHDGDVNEQVAMNCCTHKNLSDMCCSAVLRTFALQMSDVNIAEFRVCMW